MQIKLIEEKDIQFVTHSLLEIPSFNFPNYGDYIQRHIESHNPFWMILDDNKFVGHASVYLSSPYPYFRDNNIPEISDVIILPEFRRKGFAMKLMDFLENEIKTKYNQVGIGVNLQHEFGPAQKLYSKRGYYLDGNGMTYFDQHTHFGDQVIVGNSLAIWMIKNLA